MQSRWPEWLPWPSNQNDAWYLTYAMTFSVKLQLFIITNPCRIQHRETHKVDLDLVPLVMQTVENTVSSARLQTFAREVLGSNSREMFGIFRLRLS